MKKLTRKLFISVLVAVFAFVALGTSTYAWITMSTTAEVTAFEAEVSAGEAGIELSENYDEAGPTNSTWLSVLTLQNLPTVALNDLTTTDGIKFYDFSSNPTTEAGFSSEMTQNSTAQGYVDDVYTYNSNLGYIEHSIYIRRSSQTTGTTTVCVDGSEVVFAPGTGESGDFTYIPKGQSTATTIDNLFATNALRLSITGNTATAIYEQKEGENGNTLACANDGFAHSYAASQGIKLPTATLSYTTYKAGTTDDTQDSTTIITLTDQEPVKVTFRVWIEGWDNECHAQILTQKLSVKFGFRIVG